jgi:hypothetical protein
MNHADRRYVPALGFQFLTPFYDPLVAATTRASASSSGC